MSVCVLLWYRGGDASPPFSGCKEADIDRSFTPALVITPCGSPVPTVCRSWRSAVDDIVAECGSAHAGRLDVGSVPTSDLHLRLLATQKQITNLRAPSEQGETDIRLVGEWTRMYGSDTSVI